MRELERLQRRRQGEFVPPVNRHLDFEGDATALAVDEIARVDEVGKLRLQSERLK